MAQPSAVGTKPVMGMKSVPAGYTRSPGGTSSRRATGCVVGSIPSLAGPSRNSPWTLTMSSVVVSAAMDGLDPSRAPAAIAMVATVARQRKTRRVGAVDSS